MVLPQIKYILIPHHQCLKSYITSKIKCSIMNWIHYIYFLPLSYLIVSDYDLSVENDRIAITGSKDCTIKIWSLETGQAVHSIYTYNPVECLGYIAERGLVVSGSGKDSFFNRSSSIRKDLRPWPPHPQIVMGAHSLSLRHNLFSFNPCSSQLSYPCTTPLCDIVYPAQLSAASALNCTCRQTIYNCAG